MDLPKLVITDIDGVWTDGGMYYDETGNEWKKFNTSDSAGVLFLRVLDIPLAIITGEDRRSVSDRARKLRIEHLFLGVRDKLKVARTLCESLDVGLHEAAFIGDDIGDLPLLAEVGISAAPANAPGYVREKVDFVTSRKGGEGAFREFVETILEKSGCLDRVVQQVVSGIQ